MKIKGFTLIELMIAIAIVGILLSLAIPTYQDYTVRAKISEAMNVASALKVMVSEYYITMAKLPDDADTAGIDTTFSSEYISAIDYLKEGDEDSKAIIKLTLSENVSQEVAGKALLLTAIPKTGSLHWLCGREQEASQAIDLKYLPSNCR
ncbi:MAG: pilin [Gammaproteobacteria bacterium]|nr:pilin [Gammaproteobacteria bacterium]